MEPRIAANIAYPLSWEMRVDELVADEILDSLQSKGLDAEIIPTDTLGPEVFNDGDGFIICTSTYGQGDIPVGFRRSEVLLDQFLAASVPDRQNGNRSTLKLLLPGALDPREPLLVGAGEADDVGGQTPSGVETLPLAVDAQSDENRVIAQPDPVDHHDGEDTIPDRCRQPGDHLLLAQSDETA